MNQRLLAGLLALLGVGAQATEFRSADIHPDGYPTVEAVKYMSQQLSKATNGRLSIKVFNNAALATRRTPSSRPSSARSR